MPRLRAPFGQRRTHRAHRERDLHAHSWPSVWARATRLIPGRIRWRLSGLAALALLLAIAALAPAVWAGTLSYAKGFGGTFADEGFAIAVTNTGTVYVAGRFFDTVDFDPGPGISNATATGANTTDGFLSRFNASGDYVNPGLTFSGNGMDVVRAVAVDTSGNTYVTGSLDSTGSNLDIVVAKLDPSGAPFWLRIFGEAGDDNGFGITTDTSGNVYVTGQFTGTVDFDPGGSVVNLVSSGGTADVFILKLDTNGSLVWAGSLPGTDLDVGAGIAVDASRNVYATGNFRGAIGLEQGGGSTVFNTAGGGDIFVVKLDPNGVGLWGTAFGSSQSDSGNAIAVDSLGNVYATGAFRQTVDFNPGAGVSNLVTARQEDAYVVKLTTNGALVWAKQFGASAFDAGVGITVDAGGNVYVTGTFNGAANFSPTTSPLSLTSNGGFDSFVIKLDSNGTPVWGHQFGGSLFDTGNAVALDGSGNVYVTGSFSGTNIDFDPGAGSSNLTSLGGGDVFLLKLAQVAPPINGVRGAQAAVSDTPLVFSTAGSNRISVADVDNGSSPLRVTLSVSSGTLPLAGASGLSFTAGDGATDATMTFSGTLAAINTALDGLTFTPVVGGPSGATLQILTRDVAAARGVQSDTDNFAITITHRPVANADTLTVNNGATLNGNVLTNDTDADNSAPMTTAVATQPIGGAVSLQPSGAFTYTPRPNFSGQDSFTYRVTDAQALISNPGTVSITVVLIACGPRPGVTVTTAISNGALQTTLTVANDATGQTQNRLQSVQFGKFTNATVTLNGSAVASGQTVTPPANATSLTFTVRRVTPGQGTTVELTATDLCGSWPTFVGGGPSAGF